MNFLSKLFKKTPIRIFENPIGKFTLVHSKKNTNKWMTEIKNLTITVRGSAEAPDSIQLKFIENVEQEIQKLNQKITKKFIREFSEADFEITFKDWEEKFSIVGIDVMIIFQNEAYWNITFEDLNQPHAHFTLFIEGEKLTDFAIDT